MISSFFEGCMGNSGWEQISYIKFKKMSKNIGSVILPFSQFVEKVFFCYSINTKYSIPVLKKGDHVKRLILASGSPRRKELLENANILFDISVSHIDEVLDRDMPPDKAVVSLALQKAADVAQRFPEGIVLGADTIVTYENKMLGKPENRQGAREMLDMLSGNVHTVFTGVAIITPEQTITFHEATKVEFWELTEEEIENYLDSGEPFDKAGAYGIQLLGSTLVKRIEGDYFSVVGLPVSRTVRELRRLGLQ